MWRPHLYQGSCHTVGNGLRSSIQALTSFRSWVQRIVIGSYARVAAVHISWNQSHLVNGLLIIYLLSLESTKQKKNICLLVFIRFVSIFLTYRFFVRLSPFLSRLFSFDLLHCLSSNSVCFLSYSSIKSKEKFVHIPPHICKR